MMYHPLLSIVRPGLARVPTREVWRLVILCARWMFSFATRRCVSHFVFRAIIQIFLL